MKIPMLAGGEGHSVYTYSLAQMLYGRADLHFLINQYCQEETVIKINQNMIRGCPLCIKELKRKLL